ncbi:MAG TPA: DUF3017 domain-containing protein [Mycobacteriales bacterium]|jgi:hypothetical protein|nr:DUF3017 domain-containing protein [Mycobacteriales bacterium]
MNAQPRPPRPRRRVDPLAGVTALVVAGLVVAAAHQPQAGMWIVCAALATGAILRLLLRERDAGSLVVRFRRLDVLILAGLAVALGVLAAVTPFPSGKG